MGGSKLGAVVVSWLWQYLGGWQPRSKTEQWMGEGGKLGDILRMLKGYVTAIRCEG